MGFYTLVWYNFLTGNRGVHGIVRAPKRPSCRIPFYSTEQGYRQKWVPAILDWEGGRPQEGSHLKYEFYQDDPDV